jgi:DNA-binding transcriptional ArsR family regulator/predicted nucleotidyltransferase
MRTSPAIDALFPAIRRDILATLLLQPERAWYLRDLAKQVGVTPSSLTRELASLVKVGILRRQRDGNRVYYQADSVCPLFPELRGLMIKTAGVVDVLRDVLLPHAKRIECSFVFGSIARSDEHSASDVDLLVIGDIGRADLALPLRAAEKRIGRPVNPTIYKPTEFVQKLKSGHHFLKGVLDKDKLFVVGDDHDLGRIVGRKKNSSRAD